MAIKNKSSRSVIVGAMALMVTGTIVSGGKEVGAEGGAEDGAMYQSLIDSLSRVEIHGFVSQGFLWSSANDYLFSTTSKGDFRFNEIGINFSASLTRKLHVGLQLFSRSLGYVGGNQIQLDWAYADYRYEDWLGLRMGKIKIPQGIYNEIRDIDQLRSCIILPQSVYPESGRTYASGLLGLGLYGEAPIKEFGSLSYEVQGGTVTAHSSETGLISLMQSQVAEATVSGRTPGTTLGDDVDFNMDYVLLGSLFWNNPFDVDGLRFGGTFQYNSDMFFDGMASAGGSELAYRMHMTNAILWIASLEYVYDNATLAFEFREMQTDMTAGMPDIPLNLGMLDAHLHQQGFYALLSYAVTESLEMGTYYSMYWPDAHSRKSTALFGNPDAQPDHRAWQQDIALSARYDIFDFWCVKVEGHYINGTADLIMADNIDGGDWSAAGINNSINENWFLGAIKTSIMF